MNEFDLNKIPKMNFVFDFKLPNGYLPFGYNKNTLSYNIFKKIELEESDNKTLYHSSIETPSDFIHNFGAPFTTYISEHTKNTNLISVSDITYINPSELYLIVIESQLRKQGVEHYTAEFIADSIVKNKPVDLVEIIQNHVASTWKSSACHIDIMDRDSNEERIVLS